MGGRHTCWNGPRLRRGPFQHRRAATSGDCGSRTGVLRFPSHRRQHSSLALPRSVYTAVSAGTPLVVGMPNLRIGAPQPRHLTERWAQRDVDWIFACEMTTYQENRGAKEEGMTVVKPEVETNTENLHCILWRDFPEVRPIISEMWRDAKIDSIEFEREIILPGPYLILSEAFYWPLVVPAVESRDPDLLRRCAVFIDLALASSDDFLVEAMSMRVVERIVTDDSMRPAFFEFAGPLLGAKINAY